MSQRQAATALFSLSAGNERLSAAARARSVPNACTTLSLPLVAPQEAFDRARRGRAEYDAAVARQQSARDAVAVAQAALTRANDAVEGAKDTLLAATVSFSGTILQGTGLQPREVVVRHVHTLPLQGPARDAIRKDSRRSGSRIPRESRVADASSTLRVQVRSPRPGVARTTRHSGVEDFPHQALADTVSPQLSSPSSLLVASDFSPATPLDRKLTLRAIDGARKSHNGVYFVGPVSLDLYPNYLSKVTHPIDLTMIRHIVSESDGLTVGALDGFLERMQRNAETYLENDDHVVVKASREVRRRVMHNVLKWVI